MIYIVTYQVSNNEPRTMEWIAPEGWSPATITQDFEQRFAAQVLSLEPQP